MTTETIAGRCRRPGRSRPDVVVVGGGGHVGLPLGLHARHAGLRVGIYDTSAGDGRQDRCRPDALHGDRRRRALSARCWPLAACPPVRDRAAARRRRGDRGHRHADRRIPQPVHGHLRAGGRGSRPPPGRRPRRAAQHRLSRNHGAGPGAGRSRLPRGRRVRARADRGGACARGAETAADHRGRRGARRGPRRGAFASSGLRSSARPRKRRSSRLFTNAWRYEVRRRQPVLHGLMRPGSTTTASSTPIAQTTRAQPICRDLASPLVRAC